MTAKLNRPTVKMASGKTYNVPMFDPVVARHFGDASSYVETLLAEINMKEIYAPLFKGRKDLTFLDIGANIGLVSIYAYDSCARIVAVEPAPDTFTVLKAMTVSLPKIEAVRAALAPEDGPCEFFTNKQNTTASSTVNTYGTFGEVPGLMLSSILSIYQLEHVDVVKCDSEGSEGASLSFEQLNLAKDIVDQWYVECHNCPTSTWQDKMTKVLARLLALGYKNHEIIGMTLRAWK